MGIFLTELGAFSLSFAGRDAGTLSYSVPNVNSGGSTLVLDDWASVGPTNGVWSGRLEVCGPIPAEEAVYRHHSIPNLYDIELGPRLNWVRVNP